MRSSRVHCVCDMNRANGDDSFEMITMRAATRDLRLSHTRQSVCVCDTCEVRCAVYTSHRLERNRFKKQIVKKLMRFYFW